jgi:hypothetical protein
MLADPEYLSTRSCTRACLLSRQALSASMLPEPRRVLLTGATGFLGAFLLRELLVSTEVTVYCLVRQRSFVWENRE